MRSWIIASAAALAATVPAAAERAPLPAGWTSRQHDEAEGREYAAPPALRGIYGHGFSGPLNLVDREPRPDDVPLCTGSAAEQQALAVAAGSHATEFWFYATARQGVLFTREVVLPTQRPCAEGLRYAFDVARAYVVDGYVHSFEGIGDGEPSLVYSRPVTVHDREYSGGFSFLHNLMVRPPPLNSGRAENRRVAGIAARCWGQSGLVWNGLCYSRAGRSRGMLVQARAGDDERIMFDMSFRELDDDIELDGRLFELDRRWRGPG